MDTNKAKNAVIVILIILNAILFFLTAAGGNPLAPAGRGPGGRWTVTRAQYDAIQNILLRNRMILYSNIDGSDFSPRRSIRMSFYDYASLREMLWDRGDLSVRGDMFEFIAFHSPADGQELTEMTPGAVLDVTNDFLDEFLSVSEVPFEFRLSHVRRDGDDRMEVLYFGQFEDVTIASMVFLFRVSQFGIDRIISQLAVPQGFSEYAHEIYSVDEALLTLMHYLMNEHPGRDIHIDNYHLVYYYVPVTDMDDDISSAGPAYMFTIRALNPSEGFMVFVDAFTNTVVTNRVTRGNFYFTR